jgi:DNA-binding MarR family transcriptional regulator
MKPRDRGASDGLAELLAQADYLLTKAFSCALRRYGLQYREWRVLAALRDHDGQKMAELAKRTLYKPSALTHAIDRMEERGYVERRSSRGDQRAFKVFLTRHGQRTVAPLALYAHHQDHALKLSLGEPTVLRLKAAIGRLVDRLELSHKEARHEAIAGEAVTREVCSGSVPLS